MDKELLTPIIKFIVEKIDSTYKVGFTFNSDHIYGNINKVIGLWDLIKKEMDKTPLDCELCIVRPMFHFICVMSFNMTNKKDVSMFFVDTDNDEDKAIEFYNMLLDKKADEELRKEFMTVFYDCRDSYDEAKGVAELSLSKKD